MSSADSPAIAAEGVARSFAGVHAVRDVGFEAAAGRVTGLVGPNGAGKTTLLLMLASLLAPDAGEIRIRGIDPVTHPQEARRLIGWMPDALGAWGALTARETLAMTAALYDIRRADALLRADDLLAMVGLTPLGDAPARVLSRGQKQKLGLARALVHDPDVLLLDEPASGLDPAARIDLRDTLRRFADEGRAVLVSSHVLAELEEVIDDVVFLVDGATVSSERVGAALRRERAWRVRFATDDPAALIPAVAAALGVTPDAVAVDRRDLRVSLPSDAAAQDALRALVRAELPVLEFAPMMGELERTFLDLGNEDA